MELDQYLGNLQWEFASNNPNVLGQEKKARRTITAGAVEAVIAAVYLDQGLTAAAKLIKEHVLPYALKLSHEKRHRDDISELQILLQAHKHGHPVYK